MMVLMIRRAAALVIFSPWLLALSFLSLFLGRKKAVRLLGPWFTRFNKYIALAVLPTIRDSSEFDRFVSGFRRRFWLWKLGLSSKVEMEVEENHTLRVRVPECPWVDVFKSTGFPEFTPYMCQGDWAAARANARKFRFERTCQIGTGDAFCDHTFKRID